MRLILTGDWRVAVPPVAAFLFPLPLRPKDGSIKLVMVGQTHRVWSWSGLCRGLVDALLVRPKIRVSDADGLSVGVGVIEVEDVNRWGSRRWQRHQNDGDIIRDVEFKKLPRLYHVGVLWIGKYHVRALWIGKYHVRALWIGKYHVCALWIGTYHVCALWIGKYHVCALWIGKYHVCALRIGKYHVCALRIGKYQKPRSVTSFITRCLDRDGSCMVTTEFLHIRLLNSV